MKRKIELSESRLKDFTQTLCNGEAVIRNQNRIIGLIGVREKNIPEHYHGLLAKAEFFGNIVNESVVWTTEVFSSTPSRLTDLPVELQTKYRGILKDALKALAATLSDAEEPVRRLLYAAVTYPDESAIFCGDDRVVITCWGMTPSGLSSPMGMPYSIDAPDNGETNKDLNNNLPDQNQQTSSDNSIPSENKDTSDYPDSSNNSEPEQVDNNSDTDHNGSDLPPLPQGDTNDGGNQKEPPLPPVSGGDNKPVSSGGKWWKKWWWVLILLLLLLLLFFLLRSCGESNPIKAATPDFTENDVVLDDDSLRYVVGNRLMVIVTAKDATLENFAKDFKKKYKGDEYMLSNPDSVLRRITLTLPKDQRNEIKDRLPDEFPAYDLVVVQESLYKGSGMTNDPAFKEQEKRWYFDECSVFDAWDETKGDKNVIVAVIDDGFDLNHPELKGKIVKPYNAVTHDSNVFPSKSGHGTHVAATAVGNAGNGTGIAGIAPDCSLMPIQVGNQAGQMSMSAILDAVAYAIDNGAKVVNMSLGMYFGPMVQFTPEYMQKNMRNCLFKQEEALWNHIFSIARDKNVTFVLAGGNENVIVGLDPMQRSGKTINVSAVQPNRAKANFSNYGDMSTVSAPGVHIFNAVPNGKYEYMDGTSMASPIVTGGCALLLSKDPTLSTEEITAVLRATGNPSPSDVGPVVNFAKALQRDVDESNPDGSCGDINTRYQELLSELERIRREHPGCIQEPDTLSLPENFKITDLTGKWKSTTSLYNEQNQEVVIYFTFRGNSSGLLEIVEPNGEVYSAPLSVAVSNDVARIDQQSNAKGNGPKYYYPYNFELRPDRNRQAEGKAKNKVQRANIFSFNLVRI